MKVFIWWLHAMNACLVAHKVIILKDKIHCQVSTSYHWTLSLCFVYFYVERQRELSTTIQKKSCLVYSTNKACDSQKKTKKKTKKTKTKTNKAYTLNKTRAHSEISMEIEMFFYFCMFSLNTCFFYWNY